MGSKSNGWETGLLNLLFKNTDFTTVGDAGGLRGSASAGNLYFALHLASPGIDDATADQTTSEISYTDYARVAVARGAGFTVTGNSVVPAAEVAFPASTGGTGGTATLFSIGTASTGAGKVLYWGSISPTIAVTTGVTPKLTVATAVTED